MRRGTAWVLLLAWLWIPVASAAERPSRWRKVWRVSELLVAGADAADTASSWGKLESNPLLSTGSRFSYSSLAIKLGALAGGLTAQHFLARRNPEQTAVFASANLGAAGVLSLVAARNMRVPAVK